MAAEVLLVALVDTGCEIGQRMGRDIVRATLEVDRQRVRNRLRYLCAAEAQGAVRLELRLSAHGTRGQLDRHRGHRGAIHVERQRHAPHDPIAIGKQIERPDIGLLADRDTLGFERLNRPVQVLDLSEQDFALAGQNGERAQEIAVEAAQPLAQRLRAEGDLRLLERGRQDDVESDDGRSAFGDRRQDLGELARPSDAGCA